jgi:hypothetical protein
MRPRDALLYAMTTLGNRRIRKTDAEQLLNGEPAGAEHAELAALLSAAAAPGRARELADEPAMVAAFVRAYRDPSPRPARAWRPGPAWRPGRFAVVKVATGVVLFATVGTAVAAETGNLPPGLQRHAHDLFSPLGVPTPGNDGTGAARPGTAPSTPATPTASPAPLRATPGEPAVVGLCRAWAASQRDPHDNAMAPERLRALIAAAGKARDIPAFCAEKVDGVPPSTGPSPASVAPTAEHRPGGGKPSGDPPGKGGDPPGKGNGPPGNDGGRGPRSGTLR